MKKSLRQRKIESLHKGRSMMNTQNTGMLGSNTEFNVGSLGNVDGDPVAFTTLILN